MTINCRTKGESDFAIASIRGIINGTARCFSTRRSLTRSLDLSKEGLAVKATQSQSADNIAERWLPVVGDEDLYEVSDLGNVRRSSGGRGAIAGRMLKRFTPRDGYPRVDLCRDGSAKRVGVHTLVATAFIGPPPTPSHQVNHKNANKSDSRVANLEWVTPRENIRHAVSVGVMDAAFMVGELNAGAKLTWAQVAEIRSLRGQVGARPLAERYGVSRSAIQQVHQGKRWRPEDAPERAEDVPA